MPARGRALLVLAHGSRRELSNEEIRALTCELKRRLEGHYERVEAAFLEIAEPDIGAAIDRAVADGAVDIVLMPYFLSAGRHVAEDIPAIVSGRQSRHPQVRMRLQPYLGVIPGLLDLLAAELTNPRV